MASRLRFVGSTSDKTGCPALFEDLDTGDILVQGDEITDPADRAQMYGYREGETLVRVPRELITKIARDLDSKE
ncbi:hypothetical protein QA995_14730 [Streptomyces scabiei]|uniref:hypothetical protein n=1 Tax=Streptomyces scabiei TaxID=1930 RepID=UPI000765897D|nr:MULTISPECIES: hypothetical protein [Streptomyces]QTU45651.1 hypothetical protein F3K20_12940 [Streptomyces sp. LBUM 1482]